MTGIFSVGCTSKSMINLIENSQIYRQIHGFRAYYDAQYKWPSNVLSNTLLIKIKPTVLKLNYSSTVDHDTVKLLAPNLTSLLVSDNLERTIHHGMSSIIATMTNLKELSIIDFSHESDYYSTLPPLPHLQKLTLCLGENIHSNNKSYDWNILKSMTTLQSLDVRPPNIMDTLKFSSLTFLTNLQDLHVQFIDLEVEENIKSLSYFSSLKNVFISPGLEKDQLYILNHIPEELNVYYDDLEEIFNKRNNATNFFKERQTSGGPGATFRFY
jgi:hypothetical protein